MRDIAHVDPTTKPCPVCGLGHRLLTDDFVAKMRRLGMTDAGIQLLQEESDDLAAAYGCPGHGGTAKDAEKERERERLKKRAQRAKKRGTEE